MSISAHSSPKVRAVICDLYGTLLKVLPPPPDAAERWRAGCDALLPQEQYLTLPEFDDRTRAAAAVENARSRAAGEPFPEVRWLDIIASVLPCLKVKNRDPQSPGPREWISERAATLSRLHAACSRTCVAMPGAMAALHQLHTRGVLTGIASNAQDYTRAEFTGAGFSLGPFSQDLTFLSGEHGFAKPSPRVFTHLAAALATRGISPAETLMAGDREDNDILPARAAGWQTWLLTESPGDGLTSGTWDQLHAVGGIL